MKKLLILLLVGFSLQAKRKVVDRIRAIMYHPEGVTTLLESDLRPDLAGATPTLKDVIIKELVIIDAKNLKIPVSEAEVDRYLARVQEQLGMTREDLIDFLKKRGFTLERAKKELEKNLLLEMTIDHRVKSKAYVPKAAIEQYHKEHPLIYYEVKQAFVPFGHGSKAIQNALIDQKIESGEILTSQSWEPLTLKDEDIAPEKSFVKSLAPGKVVKLQQGEEGISLLQMVQKKEIPLQERLRDLTTLLGRGRYARAVEDYYKDLWKRMGPHIRFIDESDKELFAPLLS